MNAPTRPGPRPRRSRMCGGSTCRPRQLRTKFGGLFLFLPYLAAIPFDQLLSEAGLPSSKKIPAAHAMRALLALKLFGNARHSHVMSAVFDEGLALFAGLNVIPKRAFLTEYSCRIDPALLSGAHAPVARGRQHVGLAARRLLRSRLPYHSVPWRGCPRPKALTFPSAAAAKRACWPFWRTMPTTRVFCYANGQLQ